MQVDWGKGELKEGAGQSLGCCWREGTCVVCRCTHWGEVALAADSVAGAEDGEIGEQLQVIAGGESLSV